MDRMAFLLRFFRSPRMIGSITPSSDQLVRTMLEPIPWERVDSVVELGAGTGVITEALVRRTHPREWLTNRKIEGTFSSGSGFTTWRTSQGKGSRKQCLDSLNDQIHPKTHVFVFEQDPHLRDLLLHRFPYLHHADRAEKLGEVLERHGIGQADCILSSLPFTNFPKKMRQAILNEVTERLVPDGMFIAYQYSLHILPLLRERFHRVSFRVVLWNLPPAFVYICREPRLNPDKNHG
jgi:phospholipid N-methyltransferase